MLRMAHKIATAVGFSSPHGVPDDALHTASLGVIAAKKGPSIIADGISLFMNTHEKRIWDLTQDFPCVAPAFDSCVVEWVQRSAVCDDGETRDLPVAAVINAADAKVFDSKTSESRRERVLQSKWALLMSYWDAPPQRPFCGQARMLPFAGLLFVKESGQPFAVEVLPLGSFNDDAGEAKDTAWHMTCIVAMTMSFIHCKNVAMCDVTREAGPSDKWLRRTKTQRIEYKVLNIGAIAQTLRTEGGLEQNGLKKALHICRGHFASYSEDKPLFGKYTGRFWKPAHVRGDLKQGAVVKDYNVKV